MDLIELSGLSIADPSQSDRDSGDFGAAASPLSPKLRDKLKKLAKWRIDPSLIEFPEGAFEFEGGHATVSRALLIPASGADLNSPKDVNGIPNLRDENAQRKAVAVKKLKTGNNSSSKKYWREAGLLVELSHGRIIQLEGFVEDLPDARIWLIFPWEENGNLKEFVASQDWEIPERISLINVLVNSTCRAIITDFGSARRLTKNDADSQMKRTDKNQAKAAPEFRATFCATNNTMTFTGNEYTLRWAAPELLMDDEPCLSSDIWALGWIFYEVMTNSVPFENVQKDSMIIKNVIDGKLPIVTDHIRMSLILKLCSLMVQTWTVDPTKRPTAEDCSKALSWMPMVIPVPQRGSDQASPRTRSAELLMKLADMYKQQNDSANASKLYTDALNLFTESSNKKGMASALYCLGEVHWYQCEYSKASASYSKALEISTNIGNKPGRSDALWGLATLHCKQKEYGEAITLFSEVIQISIDLDNPILKADALRGLADVHRHQGNYDKAVTSYSEAVEIYTNLGNMFGRTTALAGLADVLRMQSKYIEAFALFSESLKISTDIGNKFGRAFALSGLGHTHYSQGRHHDALPLYEEAAEIYRRIGYTRNATTASENVALARSQLEVEPVKTE